MSSARFSAADRRVLLATPGIGKLVVRRLEEAGFASLSQLRRAGAERVVSRVMDTLGTSAWSNRRRALARAMACATQSERPELSSYALPR